MMHRATAQALPSSLTRRGRSGERPGQSRGLEDTGLNDWLTCEAVQPLRAALEDLVEIGEVVKGPPDRPTTWPSFNGGRWSAGWVERPEEFQRHLREVVRTLTDRR